MTLADVDGVHAIEEVTFAMPWSRESFVREVTENKCARYVVGELNGEIIAFAGTWLVIDEAHVTNIAVREDMRGRGYGEKITRALMQAAANEAAACGWISRCGAAICARRGCIARSALSTWDTASGIMKTIREGGRAADGLRASARAPGRTDGRLTEREKPV